MRSNKTYSFSATQGQVIFFSITALLICGLLFSLGMLLGYNMFASSLNQEHAKQSATVGETLPKATDAAKPTPGTAATYRIQVGAFQKEKEAHALQERLQNNGYQTDVIKVDLKENGIWYRVQVVNCGDKLQTEELARQLEVNEHLPILIIR